MLLIIVLVVLVLLVFGGGQLAPGYRTSPYYGPSWLVILLVVVLLWLFLSRSGSPLSKASSAPPFGSTPVMSALLFTTNVPLEPAVLAEFGPTLGNVRVRCPQKTTLRFAAKRH